MCTSQFYICQLEFKQLHGHTNVPRSYKIDIRLGVSSLNVLQHPLWHDSITDYIFCSVCLFVSKPQTWVALQRKEHKLHPGGNVSESKSRQDRYEKLERNGFLWDVEDS